MVLATTLLLVLGWLATATFVAAYHLLARWYRSPEGRHLMAFTGCLNVFIAQWLAYRFWGDFPGRMELLFVTFAAGDVLLVQRVVLLVRAQLARRRSQRGVPHTR